MLVQARLGSSRLPGKCLLPLGGRTLISHVLERARAVREAGLVVLCTSTSERDAPLAAEGRACGVPVYLGDELDVLRRMALAAAAYEATVVVRVTGDCPFLDPAVADAVVAFHRDDPLGSRYASNDTSRSGYPDGTDVEVMDAWVLARADEEATDRGDREHVTPWVRRRYQTATLLREGEDLSRHKLSVDSATDYEQARRVVGFLRAGDHSVEATMRALRRSEEGR